MAEDAWSHTRYEMRAAPGDPSLFDIWCTWGNGNEFPVARIDTQGAAEDFHGEYALVCQAALNGYAQAKRLAKEVDAK